LKDDPSKVQINSALNVMDDYFAPTFCGHSKLMGNKGFTKLKVSMIDKLIQLFPYMGKPTSRFGHD
jgi:hypothetical protein